MPPRRRNNPGGPQRRERDLRDIELEELRRQVQQLEQRLARGEHLDRDAKNHDSEVESSNRESDFNPFHGENGDSSDDSIRDRRAPRNNVREKSFDFKVDIPDFIGRNDPDEFLDWLNSVERVFEFKEVSEDRKVKFVATKLKKYASLWWEHLNKQRTRDGKQKIKTWSKMKKELRRKFLPDNYRQDIFLKYHNFKQRELSVEDYIAEFENLMMKCDIMEPDEQIIARFLGGLRYEIGNVVQLQPYWTYNDVCKLALKVEKQQKDSSRFGGRFSSNKSTSNRESTSSSKSIAVKDEKEKIAASKESSVVPMKPSSSSNQKSCFKCKGFGHFAADCPNRRIITLVEEEIDEEPYETTPIYDDADEEEEITYEDHGEALVVRRCLNACHVEDDSWLRNSFFILDALLMAKYATSLSMEEAVRMSWPPRWLRN